MKGWNESGLDSVILWKRQNSTRYNFNYFLKISKKKVTTIPRVGCRWLQFMKKTGPNVNTYFAKVIKISSYFFVLEHSAFFSLRKPLNWKQTEGWVTWRFFFLQFHNTRKALFLSLYFPFGKYKIVTKETKKGESLVSLFSKSIPWTKKLIFVSSFLRRWFVCRPRPWLAITFRLYWAVIKRFVGNSRIEKETYEGFVIQLVI